MGSNKRSETQGARCCLTAGHTETDQTDRQKGREVGVVGKQRGRQTAKLLLCVTELMETVDFPHQN